jgi:glycosyltransferase involved in cell wall biosynthesis
LEAAVTRRIQFVPDEEVEAYFKAADVLALPYTHVFQSGILSLAYNFGLPVVATDVGSLSEDVIPGRTGFVCKPSDARSLAKAIRAFFESDLYRHRSEARSRIAAEARRRYSWQTVGETIHAVYDRLAGGRSYGNPRKKTAIAAGDVNRMPEESRPS